MLKADRSALAAALAAVSPAIKPKNTIPVLQNVLIAKEGSRMVARGSNMDVEITCSFDAATDGDFTPFTCPVQGFEEFVKKAPEASILVEPVRAGSALTFINLRSGRSRLKLPVLPASDYPKLDAGTPSHTIELDAAIFASALSAVAYAVSTEETRHYLRGVYLCGNQAGIDVVATDGHRLERRLIAGMAFDPDTDFATVPGTLIPPDTVNRILKFADDAEDVTVEFGAEKIQISAGDVTLISKLVDGTFPDWNRVSDAPRSNSSSVRFNKSAMNDAIGRVLLATSDAGNQVTFRIADDMIVMTTRDPNSSEGEDAIAAEADTELTISFNGKYMKEALAHHAGDQVELMLRNHGDPSLLRVPGKADDFTVLMPMRILGAST